ncbi:sensor histidine kinase [Pseudoalteromonas xiamenensis]
MPFEKQITRLIAWLFIPGFITLCSVLYVAKLNLYLTLLIISLVFLSACVAYQLLHKKMQDQFVQLGNIIEALNQGDFTLRAKSLATDSAHSQLLREINRLADTLSSERFEFKESQLLLAKLLKEIDVAILACDGSGRITLANPAATKLFSLSENKLTSYNLHELGLAHLLSSQSNALVSLSSAQGGRWHLFKDQFRDKGEQQTLFILSDVEVLLSREEQSAWKNLVRVLSHEVNNSLSPIVSISATLKKISSNADLDTELKEDLNDGLTLIGERANRLHGFINAYRSVTQLPDPKLETIKLAQLLDALAALLPYQIDIQNRLTDMSLQADPSQLEQCFINLLKNAHEAAPNRPIQINVYTEAGYHHITIQDQGPGIQNQANLFVPLFTTKQGGTGLGLVLSKQIVQAHGGRLTLENTQPTGCKVTVSLPN